MDFKELCEKLNLSRSEAIKIANFVAFYRAQETLQYFLPIAYKRPKEL